MSPLDVLAVLRAPLEGYPPSLNQVTLLAKAGLRVGVLDLAGDTPAAELPPFIRRWRVHRSWNSKTEPPPPFLRRWLNWLKFSRSCQSVIRDCRPRVVMAYDILASAFVKPKPARHRTIYHFHELPDPEPREGLGPRLGRARAARFSREADLVVFSDVGRAQCYMTDARLERLPEVVMNCPMRMGTVPISSLGNLLAQRGQAGWQTVYYLGSVGLDQGVLEAVQSMHLWPAQTLFILVGPCSATIKQRILELAGKAGAADRVLFVGPRPHREALALTAGADVGLALIQPNTRNWLYSAGAINKRFEYMALGLPQVTNAGPGVKEIVEANACGLCIDPKSIESIGQAVRQLLENDGQRRSFSVNARDRHLRTYNYESQFAEAAHWITSHCSA